MPCHRVHVPGGYGIVCTGRQQKTCADCGRRTARHSLCDWKLSGAKKGKTCDRVLCASCATSPARDKHLCSAHARRWAEHPSNPQRVESAVPSPGDAR